MAEVHVDQFLTIEVRAEILGCLSRTGSHSMFAARVFYLPTQKKFLKSESLEANR